jgi:signal transduction histidine kinase
VTSFATAAPSTGRIRPGALDVLARERCALAALFGSDDGMIRRLRAVRASARRLLDPPERDHGPGPLQRLFAKATSFVRTHVRITDALIALLVFTFGLLADEIGHHSIVRGVFTFLLALPLVWRRRAPISVFLVIAAIAFIQWLSNIQLASDISLLVALYTVADERPHRAAVGIALILETGAVLATIRWSTGDSALRTFALLSGVVVASLISGIYFRARRAHVASLMERATRLELERDQQARLAAAAERARIAREMHDVIAHSLAVVIALADGARAKLRRDPEQAREALESVSDIGRQALDDTRRLLSVLRTEEASAMDRSPQPGIDEITDLVDQVASTGITATLVFEGEKISLATGPALAAYRIVQEAITNALKHAEGATAISVALTWAPRQLEISVADNGHCDSTRSSSEIGFGLEGMRERAALYDGSAIAGPNSTGGWVVHAVLPTTERAAR